MIAILGALAEVSLALALACMAVLAVLMPVLIVIEHRAVRRVQPLQPEPSGPDPDIAWALQDDADPAAVARLQAELARPLPELVAEGERKAIAAYAPLAGDPGQVRVKDCTVSDRRQFPPPEDVVVVGPGSGVRYAVQPMAPAIEVTAMGDRERSFVRGPSGTNYSGQCYPAGGGGGGASGTVTFSKEPDVLTGLRERRFQVWQQARDLADVACMKDRPFTDEEQDRWDWLNRELQFVDQRIMAVLVVMQRCM